MLSAAVVTISDSVAAGTRQNLSGLLVAERLQAHGWHIAASSVVTDDRAAIAAELRRLAETPGLQAIFTTGGTGFGPRDITPEATREVIDREAPGLAELMRAEGVKYTAMAALSRGVCGSFGAVLIVNLPGSPKGALESLDAIVELAPHAVRLLGGDTEH